jgi:hypothetical protein
VRVGEYVVISRDEAEFLVSEAFRAVAPAVILDRMKLDAVKGSKGEEYRLSLPGVGGATLATLTQFQRLHAEETETARQLAEAIRERVES